MQLPQWADFLCRNSALAMQKGIPLDHSEEISIDDIMLVEAPRSFETDQQDQRDGKNAANETLAVQSSGLQARAGNGLLAGTQVEQLVVTSPRHTHTLCGGASSGQTTRHVSARAPLATLAATDPGSSSNCPKPAASTTASKLQNAVAKAVAGKGAAAEPKRAGTTHSDRKEGGSTNAIAIDSDDDSWLG